jgi:GNAT superfamily N-acetyltransferase
MTSRLQALRADLRCQLRRDGLRAMLRKLGGRARSLRSPSDGELLVMVKDLERISAAPGASDLRVEDLESRHLPALFDLNRRRCYARADRRFAEYVAHGYGGFVGFLGEELVGYYWWVDRTHRPKHRDLARLRLGIELAEGEVYGSDFYILEAHRGGGVADDFLYKLETGLRGRGYRRLWGYVESDNRPARWTYSVRGYQPTHTVTKKRGRA